MSDWDERNHEFMAAALRWLRGRLQTLDGTHVDVSADEDAMEAAAAVEPPPAAILLERRLGLRRFERDVLLLCAAADLDPSLPALCARVQGDPRMAFPTFALALSLFDDPSWDALAPNGALRYWRAIEITQPPGQPLTSSALRADERIVSYLKGLNYLDDRLDPLVRPVEAPEPDSLPPSQRTVAASIAGRWTRLDDGDVPVIQLTGPDAASKRMVAAWTAAACGYALYELPADLLPSQAAELEDLARLWSRESRLTPVALYIDAQDADPSDSVRRFVGRITGMTFLATREVWLGVPREPSAYEIERPLPVEQREAWEHALGGRNAGTAPADLAGQFRLNLPTIERVAAAGAAVSDGELERRLWDECLRATRPRMDALAQRVEPRATWDDIVLPDTELELLHALAAQVRHRHEVYESWGFGERMNRGLGISALFAGPSGTGKSMAAEVIANDLRLALYRIDLSAVVSKYIGETEKNLRRVFDAAEEGGALLLFDEADALFGKRSDVKDSHDRYANIEVDYLLQRMEAYRGVAILATNLKSALDTAFMRRLRFVVSFEFPAAAERRLMWERAFPSATPTGELDFDRLAGLAATGAMIHNIALNAAFVAAERREPVTMQAILDVARNEFRKLELPINERRFALPTEVAA